MTDTNPLAGWAILVTGASRGIGAAVAVACAQAGAAVGLTARDADGLEGVAARIRRSGGSVDVFPADARDERAVERTVTACRHALGRVDGAVVNQGINRIVPVAGLATAHWHDVIETNLTGSFFFARALARLDPLPRGIVFVSSVSGLPGYRKFPGFAAYCASKRGVIGLAEVLAVELADRGTRIATICPRGVGTEMFRQTFPAAEPDLTPESVANAVVGLLDPATAPPTGTVVEL